MSDFSSRTYQALRQEMLDRVPDTYDKRDTQPIPTSISPAAYVAEGIYIDMDWVQKQGSILTATGQGLDDLSVFGGISRLDATPAVALGLFNTDIPLGSRFSTINGADSIDFTATQSVGGHQYQLTADTPGEAGSRYTGPLLPITAIPGLTSAQITRILIPGEDTETDAEFRARLIEALTDRPFGGNIAAYRQQISAMDGVGAVQVYPTWDGGGTVKCSVLGADLAPASPELVQQVQQAIDPPPGQGLGLGLAPIGAKVTITAPETVEIQVSARLMLQSGYAVGQVQQPVEKALAAYLASVSEAWGTNISTSGVAYAANIYIARIIAAIVGVAGIVNAADVQINGASEDLSLTETGTLQQVPKLGEVSLSE